MLAKLAKIGSVIWWVIRLGGIAGALRDIYQVLAYLVVYGPSLVVAALLSTFDFAEQMDIWIRVAFFVGVFFCALAVIGTILAFVIRHVLTSGGRVAPENRNSVPQSAPTPDTVAKVSADGSTSRYPLPQALPADIASRTYINGLPFRITELPLQKGEAFVGITFENCIIHGPAIFAPTHTIFARHNQFVLDSLANYSDTLFYEFEPQRDSYTGIIGAHDCTFRGCTFIEIGIMGTSETIQLLKEHIAGKGDVTVSD